MFSRIIRNQTYRVFSFLHISPCKSCEVLYFCDLSCLRHQEGAALIIRLPLQVTHRMSLQHNLMMHIPDTSKVNFALQFPLVML